MPKLDVCLDVFYTDLGYEERRARLDPGDLLLLFSDGVTEATSPDGEEFGEERLAKLLIANGRGGAANLVEGIRQAVLAWAAGAAAADDVTVVVASRVP